MPKPKVDEAAYYQAVGEWFVKHRRAKRWVRNVAKSTLWSADVLGGTAEKATVACELKCLAYPNGSAGAGAIGQAIALRVFVPEAYVALVVGETLGLDDCSWRNPKKNQRMMAELLQVNYPEPKDFASYRRYVGELFLAQFRETGLGLLVVNADDGKTVKCVVKAVRSARMLPQPKQWVESLRKAKDAMAET
jgi:hypothetical protein